MKKALIITTVSGFVPQFEMNNVKLLQKLGYKVHYASNFKNPHYGSDNHKLKGTGIICHQVDFVRSPFQVCQNLRAYRQLCKLLRKNSFEIVHCHTPMGGVLGRLAAEKIRRENIEKKKFGWRQLGETTHKVPTRVIYTAHGFHFYKGGPFTNWLLYYPVERMLARITDTLITINEEDYRRARRFRLRVSGAGRRQLFWVHGVGIDINSFKINRGNRKEKRQELGIPNDAFFFVSVGELNQNKNHRIVLKAFAEIQEENLYYGIFGDGGQKEKLENQIHKLGLKNVTLYGYQKDIPDILQAADAFIFPSLREGLGLAALEALACGLPVIAYDNRGTREYMKDGENGYVVKENSPILFAAAIHKMCGIPYQEYKTMGDNSKTSAQKFGIQEVEKKMEQIYMEKMGRQKNHSPKQEFVHEGQV